MLHLFWSPLETSGGAKAHLRVFVLLRLISFALSTLQLRSGYPPPASYRCINAKYPDGHVIISSEQGHLADASQINRQDKTMSVQHVCFPSQHQLAIPEDAVPVLCRGGRGRHSFVFSRSTGQLSWLGFQTFCSVPFLYELRQILDWSCTPTTLNLFDWLKLEVSSMCLCTVPKAVSSHMLALAGMLCRDAPV